MKIEKSKWFPTKFEKHRNGWRAARSWGISSRLITNLQCYGYTTALERHAHGRLIDLGCGNAPLAGIYRSLVKEFIWVDWPNSPYQIFQLDFEVDLNGDLPFDNNSFDTILLSDVIEHIAQPDHLFSEMVRILRPGGIIILGVPFFYYLHEEPYDYQRFTKFGLEALGNKHSVRAINIEEVGGAFDVWSDLTGKLLAVVWEKLAWVPFLMWMTLKAIPWIARFNARGSWRFPLAYIAVYEKVA